MCSLTSAGGVGWSHLSISSAPTGTAQDPLCLNSCSSALLTWCLCVVCWDPWAPLGKAVPQLTGLSLAVGSSVLCSQVQDTALPLVELYTALVAQSPSLFMSLKGGSPCQCVPLNTQFSDTANVVRVLLVPSSGSFMEMLQCGTQY